MLPAEKLRFHLLLVAIAALAPLGVYAAMTRSASASAAADVPEDSASHSSAVRKRVGEVLARVTALIDSSPRELALSASLTRSFGFGDSTTGPLADAVSIALLDTTGARVAMLMGSGARIDAIALERRRVLAQLAVARNTGGGVERGDSAAITIPNTNRADDSIAYHLVKSLPTSVARCDCLLDTHGAILAVVTQRALRPAPQLDDGRAPSNDSIGTTIGGVTTPRSDTHSRNQVLLGLLALLIGGIGTTLARRAHRDAQLVPQLQASQKLVVLDVNEMVLSAVGKVSQSLGRAIKVETQLNISPALVLADRRQLFATIATLIGAARAELPDGGTLRLTTSFVEVGADAHAREGAPLGSHIVLTVDAGSHGAPSRDDHGTGSRNGAPSAEPTRRAERTGVAAMVQAHHWHLREDVNDEGAHRVAIYMPLAEASLTQVLELQGLGEETGAA